VLKYLPLPIFEAVCRKPPPKCGTTAPVREAAFIIGLIKYRFCAARKWRGFQPLRHGKPKDYDERSVAG
jgi:hypothetical protein